MSSNNSSGGLLLPDIQIKGFCGIQDLTINRLGQVTLIAGMNSFWQNYHPGCSPCVFR